MTELIDHAIAEGNKLLANTIYHDSWWMYHDHLSAWWEAGAQEYLAERGIPVRQ